MKTLFIKGPLSLSAILLLTTIGVGLHAQHNTPLDEQAQVGLQQSLNDIFNRYNGEISQTQSQIESLRTTGMQQCTAEAEEMKRAALDSKDQADTQAMASLIEPGMETLGHLVDGGLKMGSGAKAEKEEQLQKIINACNSTLLLDCDKNGAEPLPITTANCPESAANPAAAGQCRLNASSEASRYTTRITTLNKELASVNGMTENLIGTGMKLAGAGITGSMLKKQAGKQAEGMIASAEAQKALCQQGIQNEIANLQRKLQQLDAAKARDIMMANMMAEYQTRQRERNIQDEDVDPDEVIGNIVDLGLPQDTNIFDPIKNAGLDGVASPAGGGGAPAGAGGGTGGGGVEDPAWIFGSGAGGFDGGSPLPAQPGAAGYTGTAASPTNTKGPGGFGALNAALNDNNEGERGPASIEPQELGDGGLQVLLTRTTIVHSRHAATLVRGVDFEKLAQSSGGQDAQKAASPATRY